MKGSIRIPRLVRGLGVALVVAALATAGGVTPAGAQGLSTSKDRAAEAALGEATARAAMERDLGLSGAALDELLAASAEAVELETQLQEEIGAEFAGAWLDEATGSLVVAVTDTASAQLASAAGAETTLVTRSERELTTITDALDEAVEADPSVAGDLFSWGIDPASNQVVVTARAGEADLTESLVAEYGDAVRVEESAHAPQTTQAYPWLDAGIPFNGCSTGFNVRNPNTGARYFITAGHCGSAGAAAFAGNGVLIGNFVESWFPGLDDAIVQVTNTAYWLQGPYVWTWPGFVSISNTYTDAPVNTQVCSSGKTTGWTCGRITAKNVSVNYFDNNGVFIGTVNGLTQHNACTRQGDSGGPDLNVSSSPFRAEGMNSGASLLPNGQCQATPVSWYFPIADSLPYYGPNYGVSLY
jgi:streptogrisin C